MMGMIGLMAAVMILVLMIVTMMMVNVRTIPIPNMVLVGDVT